MKKVWPPVCSICNKSMEVNGLSEGMSWIVKDEVRDASGLISITDIPLFAHFTCWSKSDTVYRSTICRTSEVVPFKFGEGRVYYGDEQEDNQFCA